jgi:hypothetical protein
VTPSHALAALVASVAAGGLLLSIVGRAQRPLRFLGIGVVLIPLTYLPNLVVRDQYPPFRTQVSLAALIALYAGLGALALWIALRDSLRPHLTATALKAAERIALGAATAVVAVSVVSAAKNVTTLIVQPQMTELRLFRAHVAALPDQPMGINFILTDRHLGMTTLEVFDEYGLPSTSRAWVVRPWAELVLREEGRLALDGPRPLFDIYSPDSSLLPNDRPVLDLRRELKRLRGTAAPGRIALTSPKRRYSQREFRPILRFQEARPI